MSRYIDTKWLEDNAKEYSLGYYESDEWATPLSALDEAPSIDIVQCKECKHKEKCTMVAHHLTVGKGIKFVPITYCSAGERQTERSE